MNAHSPVQADAATVRAFLAMVHERAASALRDAVRPGHLQLTRIHPAHETAVSTRYRIGDVDGMVADAMSAAASGHNVYVEGRTIAESAGRGRGKLTDTRGVFAFVVDSDADKGMATRSRAEPTCIVETSPGNAHHWLFLGRALTADEAQPIGAGIRAATGADSDTGNIAQPYRVAGTPNFPGPKKVARGRYATPTKILPAPGKVWAATDLATAFPAPKVEATQAAPTGVSGRSSNLVVDIVAEAGPDRSMRFHDAVEAAASAGMTVDDLELVMREHPDGCASKYLQPYDRLRKEIERSWSKPRKGQARPGLFTTYPDQALPIAAARASVETAVRGFLQAATAHRALDTTTADEDETAPPAPVHAVKVATGIGKTTATARLVSENIHARRAAGDKLRPILFCVPTHRLGDEIVELFDRHGVTARVFRGRSAPDPDRAGQTMCDDLEAVQIALDLGETVSTACCKGKRPNSKEWVECPFFTSCSYQRQKTEKPDVWIVAHQLLFQAQASVGQVDAVVIDEGFWQSGLRIPTRGLTLDEIAAPLPMGKAKSDEIQNDVEENRRKLARALRRQDDLGGVHVKHLQAEWLSADLCTNALAQEWQLKESVPIWPGMPPADRRKAAAAARGSKHVIAFASVWKGARDLLNSRQDVSGRLYLDETDSDEGYARVVKARSVKSVAKQWYDAPTLILDATLPAKGILAAYYPAVEITAEIDAAMPFVHVRQVVGAPVSSGKLRAVDGGANRNLKAVRREILREFLRLGRKPLLVVAQKAVAEWLAASDLPDGVSVEHFNNTAGLDRYKAVRGLMVIGRTIPSPSAVEALAGAISGTDPVKIEGRWYDKADHGIRLRDGSAIAIEADVHPDPLAEACRWQICEGELVQSIGRARGVNRDASTPLDITILADIVLPMTVDEVRQWSADMATDDVTMELDGIELESPSDMAECWPAVWSSPEAARDWRKVHRRGNAFKSITYIGSSPPVRCRYQRPGARQKWRTASFDPAVLPQPRAWLEARLGPLAGFELVPSEIAPGLQVDTRGRLLLTEAPSPIQSAEDAGGFRPLREFPRREWRGGRLLTPPPHVFLRPPVRHEARP